MLKACLLCVLLVSVRVNLYETLTFNRVTCIFQGLLVAVFYCFLNGEVSIYDSRLHNIPSMHPTTHVLTVNLNSTYVVLEHEYHNQCITTNNAYRCIIMHTVV